MEKKSLVRKKAAPSTKSSSTTTVDTSKPTPGKVVAAKGVHIGNGKIHTT